MKTRIVFFGTPEFAVPTLEALVASGRAPKLVVTQQARRAGRGARLRQPPVARSAADLDLSLEQPATLRSKEFRRQLRDLELDAIVVVAYGKIFGRQLLAMPRWGCLNVHASLLPKHRGAAPVQSSILAGDEVTGVTIMRMAQGLDNGPILLQSRTPIDSNETAAALSTRLSELGAAAMVDALESLEQGRSQAIAQDEALASYSGKIAKSDGRVDWNLTAVEIARRWRAYSPWPGSTTSFRGRPLKLLEVELPSGSPGSSTTSRAGQILGLDTRRELLRVACGARGDTILGLRVVQRPGRRPVRAVDFVHGEQLVPGELFATD